MPYNLFKNRNISGMYGRKCRMKNKLAIVGTAIMACLFCSLLIPGIANHIWPEETIETSSQINQPKQSTNSSESKFSLPRSITLPVIMYHSVSDEYESEWTITDAQLRQDLDYLKKEGFEAVLSQDLIDFVDGKGQLPAKPILLTFDDGYQNNYTTVFPMLKEFHQRAVVLPIGIACDCENQVFLNWDQVKEMKQDGCIEIGNHTWDMHRKMKNPPRQGCKKLKEESIESYQEMLKADLETLQNKIVDISGSKPICFAYPYGARSKEAEHVLHSMGFKLSLLTKEGFNTVKRGDSTSLLNLKRYNRAPNRSLEAILKKM